MTKEQITVAKRIFWLAYQFSPVVGMGAFQAKDGVTKEDVWNNITNSLDYAVNISPPNAIYADYVFGRMMKLGIRLKDGEIEIYPEEFRPDYQGFSHKYPDPKSLYEAAHESEVRP